MPELFATYDREEPYADRLTKLADERRTKLTDADFKAVRCLLEERARFVAILGTVAKMRKAQHLRDRAQTVGVSREQGLEQLTHEAGQLEVTVDRQVGEELGDEESTRRSESRRRQGGRRR